MSFGDISLILDKIMVIINKNNYNNISDIYQIKKKIKNELSNDFPDIDSKILDEIIKRLYSVNYSLNEISFDNGKNCFREFEENYPSIKIPKKYQKLENHFNKLLKMPQPVQRTKEWFDYRYNRITASDTAAAIDLNPYEPVESFILKKCDPDYPFRDNATVFHGKKYEPIATMIYEHIYNNRVFEFGALPSEKYSFLGASPDGICSKYTLDNKFSDRLGTMLEIKCPVTREIHTSGNIIGDICPFYYYCQIQQQLECCELDNCDFWQCKLTEYKSKYDYLDDDCSKCQNTEGNNSTIIHIDNKLKKGIILEFYPKNFQPEFPEDNIEWKSKYIIPKRLDMNIDQYNSWILNTLDEYKILYPEIDKNYYFNKIIYWKLDMSHNVSIKRDDVFLNNIIPILQDTWNKIVYYRKNKDKLDELREISDRRKKYIKINTNYKISNNEVIKDKFLFLDSSFISKKNIINNCNFIND